MLSVMSLGLFREWAVDNFVARFRHISPSIEMTLSTAVSGKMVKLALFYPFPLGKYSATQIGTLK